MAVMTQFDLRYSVRSGTTTQDVNSNSSCEPADVGLRGLAPDFEASNGLLSTAALQMAGWRIPGAKLEKPLKTRNHATMNSVRGDASLLPSLITLTPNRRERRSS